MTSDPEGPPSEPTLLDEVTIEREPSLATAVDPAGPSVEARGPALPVSDETAFLARYRVGEVLGEGGMGEVRLCTDTRIGRAVAMAADAPTKAYARSRSAPSKLPWTSDCMDGSSSAAPIPPMSAQKTMIAVRPWASVIASAPAA